MAAEQPPFAGAAPPPAPPAASHAPTAPIGPMPGWAKVALGCLTVLAVLGVVLGILGIVAMWWMFSPGRQIATDRVVTPDAVAVVYLSGDGRLDGLADLVNAFVASTNEERWRQNRELLPPPLRWVEPLARMNESQSGQQLVGMFLPREATVAVTPDGGGTRVVAVAANLRTFTRPLRFLLSRAARTQGRAEGRGDDRILRFGRDAALCFVEGTLLWSSRASALDRVLQRARADSPPDRPAFMPAASYDRWKAAWSLAAVADGRDEQARDLLAGVLQPRDAGGAEAPELDAASLPLTYLEAGMRIATADRAEAQLVLVAPDAASASRWRAVVDSFLARETEAAKAHDLTLTASARETAEGVVADVRLDGLQEFLRRWAAEQRRRLRTLRPAPPPESPDTGKRPTPRAWAR